MTEMAITEKIKNETVQYGKEILRQYKESNNFKISCLYKAFKSLLHVIVKSKKTGKEKVYCSRLEFLEKFESDIKNKSSELF